MWPFGSRQRINVPLLREYDENNLPRGLLVDRVSSYEATHRILRFAPERLTRERIQEAVSLDAHFRRLKVEGYVFTGMTTESISSSESLRKIGYSPVIRLKMPN